MDAFITRRGGAGGGLNFKVVGGMTKPGNPKENTIWVETDQEITGWSFRNGEPSEPVEGLVWIELDKNSAAKFNALKENEIQMCPIKAHIYTSGAWDDDIPAKHYSNGSWNDLVVCLFKDGNQYSDVTGGWVHNTSFAFNSSNNGKGTVTIGQTIKCVTGTGQSAYASTVKKVDVSEYSSIVVHVSEVGSKTYELTLMPSTGNMADKAVAYMKLSSEVNTLPINIDGAYYICVGTAGGEKIEVTQIYLKR